MVDNQTTIFEMLYPTYKINKPIRLITLFSGYDSQALALKYLGVEYEHYKTCEWAVKSIQALKDLHFENDNTNYSKDLTTDELKEYLLNKGISSNYNDPMTQQQVNRLSEKQARTIYNNIKATHNLVNIQQVKGQDLEIVDTDKYEYIMTYSFPYQDLSLAGKGKGMSDTSTRSGMLWEVERILTELEEKPQILLMENVPMIHSQENTNDFNKWQLRLEELGYKNYWQDLIATDYGIPQTRNRTFMVSILGDYNYTFPKPIPLKLKLKDMLEDNVDEKYYLSDKMLEYITSKDDKYQVNENNLTINREIACSKTTREGNTRADTTDYICDELPENFNIKNGCKQVYNLNYYNHEQSNRVYSPEYSSPTLRTKCDEAGTIKIINATKQGYLEATEGDGIDISSRMEYHRGTVQKDKIQTITTSGGEHLGVVVKKIGNYSPSNHNASSIVDKNYSAPTVMENHGTITAIVDKPKVLAGIGEKKSNGGTQWYQQDRIYDDNISISITTECNPYYKNNLRIRKLTPRECFRLMGVDDEGFDKIAKNQSDASLYHLAGDSIVVNVLMAIFKEML